MEMNEKKSKDTVGNRNFTAQIGAGSNQTDCNEPNQRKLKLFVKIQCS